MQRIWKSRQKNKILFAATTLSMSFLSALLARTSPMMNNDNMTPTATKQTYPFRNISAVSGGIGLGLTKKPPNDVK